MSQITDASGTMLSPPRVLDLGEADSSIDAYPAFATGSMLGITHALGGGHRHLQKSSTVLEAFTGLGLVIDDATGFYRELPSPERAAAEMMTPFRTFPPEEFDTFLRGYIAATYGAAPNSGEYVDDLLRRLGIQAGFDPRPRAFSFDPGRVLACLGWRITVSGRQFVVALTEPDAATDGEDLGVAVVQLLLVFALLDVDCRVLRDYAFPAATSSEWFPLQMLSIVLCGSHGKSPGDQAGTIACTVVLRWEAALRAQVPNREALNSGVFYKALITALVALEPHDAESFSGGLIDWCDFLALVADTPSGRPVERVQLSLKAAQFACILVQRPYPDTRAAEIRCATLSQRHNWLHALRRSEEPVDHATLRAQVTYAHSRALAFMQAFKHSAAGTSMTPLHSLRWKALMLCRRGIAAVGDPGVVASGGKRDVEIIMMLARTLAQLALTALAEGRETFIRFGGGRAGDLVIEELGLLTAFHTAATAGDGTSTQKLADVSRFYRGEPWRWLRAQGIWALWR